MFVDELRREISAYIEKEGITVKRLAKIAGVSYRALLRFLQGEDVRVSNIGPVVDVIRKRPFAELEPVVLGKTEEEYIALPVYAELGAGGPRDATDYVGEVCVPIRFARKGVYALKVRGNSMYPSIVDGSVVGVDTLQKELMHDKIYAFHIRHSGSVIKRAIILEGGDVLLKSDNESYPSYVFKGEEKDDLVVIGRVVWSVQVYGSDFGRTSD